MRHLPLDRIYCWLPGNMHDFKEFYAMLLSKLAYQKETQLRVYFHKALKNSLGLSGIYIVLGMHKNILNILKSKYNMKLYTKWGQIRFRPYAKVP